MSYVEENDRLRAEVEQHRSTASMRAGMLKAARDRAEKAEGERDRARDLAAHLEEELAERVEGGYIPGHGTPVLAWVTADEHLLDPAGRCVRGPHEGCPS